MVNNGCNISDDSSCVLTRNADVFKIPVRCPYTVSS